MNTTEIELPNRRTRRRHAPEFRERVVQACQQPGVSIAAVALANGLNANMVRKWLIDAQAKPGHGVGSGPLAQVTPLSKPAPSVPVSFVPLTQPAPSSAQEIRIEVQRGTTAIKVAWP